MKIAVYTIVKNEAKEVKPFMDTCREADQVVIADTGSTDGTPDLLRQEGATVASIAVKPWRFDVARIASLCLVPADVDVCISIDLDERLQPGWRQELEKAWQPGTTRLSYWYTWSWKGPGVPDVQFRANKIHARADYTWRYALHEVPMATGPEQVADSDLAIHHFPDPAKPRPDGIPLLELAAREDRCPRTVFYLGREYFFRGRWPECIRTLEEYLAMPHALWRAERSHAMRLIGGCHRQTENAEQALAWLLRACAEDLGLRENWIDLAQCCYEGRDWSGGYSACERALAIKERPAHYQSFGYAWGERAHDLAAVCAWYLGLKDRAAEHLRQALALSPDDPRLQSNAQFILPQPGGPGQKE